MIIMNILVIRSKTHQFVGVLVAEGYKDGDAMIVPLTFAFLVSKLKN